MNGETLDGSLQLLDGISSLFLIPEYRGSDWPHPFELRSGLYCLLARSRVSFVPFPVC